MRKWGSAVSVLKLEVSKDVARAFPKTWKTAMLALAKGPSARRSGSPASHPALVLALNPGMRKTL